MATIVCQVVLEIYMKFEKISAFKLSKLLGVC